jgi:hypothetical protein
LNHVPTDIPAHLTGEDLIIDDNAVISVYSGNEQSTAIFPTAVFLQKTTLDGERVWLKKYDFTAFVEERATELVRVSDGYIIFGQSRTHNQSQGGLFILKTDLDGEIMWARIYRYSDYDYVFTATRDQELLELDGFLYFTAFSEDSEGGTDLILGKLNSEGFVSDSCHFIQSTQVESYTVVSTDSTSPQLVFQNLDIETTTPQPTPLTQAYSLQAFQNICEHSCTEDVGCDLKINGCLTFELLNITADSEGNNTYRMRVTNVSLRPTTSCPPPQFFKTLGLEKTVQDEETKKPDRAASPRRDVPPYRGLAAERTKPIRLLHASRHIQIGVWLLAT